jgi:hypothetical protein
VVINFIPYLPLSDTFLMMYPCTHKRPATAPAYVPKLPIFFIAAVIPAIAPVAPLESLIMFTIFFVLQELKDALTIRRPSAIFIH